MVADADNLPIGQYAYNVGVVGGSAPELLLMLESEGVKTALVLPGRRDQGDVDVLILDLTETHRFDITKSVQAIPPEGPPVVAAISWDLLRNPETKISVDDVIVVPWRRGELLLRIARLLERKTFPEASRVISAGDLFIDPDRYDVFVGN